MNLIYSTLFDKMSAREKLQWVIDRITYKPGWKVVLLPASDHERWMSLHRAGFEYLNMQVQMEVQNLDRSGRPFNLAFHKQILSYTVEHMPMATIVDHVIRDIIIEAEMHEMDEWLRFDGFNVREPHPEKKMLTCDLRQYLKDKPL